MMAAPFDEEEGTGGSRSSSSSSNNMIDKKKSAHAARNRTQKLYPSPGARADPPSDKVKSVMARLHEEAASAWPDDDGGDLGDYYAAPPPPPDSVGSMRSAGKEAMQNATPAPTPSPPPPATENGGSGSGSATRPPKSASDETYLLNHLQQNYGDEASVHDYYRRYVPQFHPSQLQARGGAATPAPRTTPAWVQRGGSSSGAGLSEFPEESKLLEKLNYMIHLLEEKQDERTHHVAEEVVLYAFLGIFVIFIVDSFTRVGKYTR